MQKILLLLLLILFMCGCPGGPTHDYYNPTVTGGEKFKGPVTMALVDDIRTEKAKCLQEGYKVIGTTDYVGKYPEAVELKWQARRVHANHVIYSVERVSAKPGSWHFGFSGGSGWGGSDSDQCGVHIIFLGR